MGIDSAPGFQRALDLNPIVPCGNRIVWVSALHDQVGVPVEMTVFHEDA